MYNTRSRVAAGRAALVPSVTAAMTRHAGVKRPAAPEPEPVPAPTLAPEPEAARLAPECRVVAQRVDDDSDGPPAVAPPPSTPQSADPGFAGFSGHDQIILFSSRPYDCSDAPFFVARYGCPPNLLPSFDLLWTGPPTRTKLVMARQTNLLYTAEYYATAALLFSPQQKWPRPRVTPEKEEHCKISEQADYGVKVLYWDPAAEPMMRKYVGDGKRFLDAHSVVLRLPKQ